jgi:hypothetical protein
MCLSIHVTSIQFAACGCAASPFTTQNSFFASSWGSCTSDASERVCTMGCACNKALLHCSDFCDSTAGGAVTPLAWYPYANAPASKWSYEAITSNLYYSLKKTSSSTETAFLHEWVEDASMKAACISGTTWVCVCVCVCVATFLYEVLYSL